MKESASSLVASLEAWKYSDPRQYQLEIERIFYGQWIYVAHSSQIPTEGCYVTAQIGTNPIFLVRGKDGHARAFYNVCAHRGHWVVEEGSGQAGQFVCPYHAWVYDSAGKLKRAPGLSLDESERACRGLRSVEMSEWNGFLFVRLQDSGATLEDTFGEAFRNLESYLPYIDRLKYVRRYTHAVDGNWKVLVDNYLECYHCPQNHPSFVDLMKVQQYAIETFSRHSTHRAPAGRSDNTAYKYQSGSDVQNAFDGWWLWPNLTFNMFPGGPNLLAFHMHPLSPDTSIGYCDYFFVDGVIDDQAEALMNWETHVLSEEDNERVAAVHRGMKSMALRAGSLVNIPQRGDITEHAIRHFHDLVEQAVRADFR